MKQEPKNKIKLIILLALIFVPSFVLAGTIDSTYKYAWADSAGWINFNPTNGNVTITNSVLTGYIWNELYGWINLNPTNGGVFNTTSGIFSGYAWGENAGWINFSGVVINCSGKFTGTATGDTIGTITFDCANCDVRTDWRRSVGCGGTEPPLPVCGDNTCNGTENCSTCPGDCGACLPVCGDSVCNGTETCAICPSDCGVCAPVCGDGSCQNPETCQSCSADCGQCIVEPSCGDNSCNGAESCQNCPADCGACQVSCGDSVCNGTENCSTCSLDCGVCLPVCGDSVCNGEETCGNCPLDCGSCGEGGISFYHNECNTQKQCVSVSGQGQDQCYENSDCEEKTPIETITEIVEMIQAPMKAVEQIVETVKEQIPETVKTVAKETKKIIETPQGSVATKTISTTGAVVTAAAAASAVLFSPFEIFLILIRLVGILLTAFGFKKRVRPWGVVYDSVTKQPLDPAYVVLKDLQGKTISSAITDLDGRYGFLAGPGIYKILVNKTNYIFPSQKLLGVAYDELYQDLYFGQNIEIKQPFGAAQGEAIIKNIPMDPLKFDWNEFAKRDKRLMRFYSNFDVVLRKIFDWFFMIGFIVAVISYFSAPYPYNLIILIVYLALLFLRVIGIKPRAYGRIMDAAGSPLSFALLRVVSPDSNIEIARKAADKYGRYYCLVPQGKYYVRIEKKNDDGSYSLVYTSALIDVSKKGIIKNNFRI